jgi:tricorn protease-like protein
LSPDGKTLAYVYRESDNDYNQIILSNMATRQVIAKVPFNGELGNQFAPRFSPDSKHLAFNRYFPSLPGTTDYSPRVSLDGKHLIFVRGQLKPSHHSAIFLL